MAIKEQDKVFYEEAENGDKVINLPVTRVNNVEGLGRSANTAYVVNDVVYVDNNKKVALKCTQAGTTSSSELNVSTASIGNTITDGTVKWQVCNRTSDVTSVNGKTGDVVVEGLPVGTIISCAGNTVPSGFLPCSGASLNPSTYVNLFNEIGTTYGGDGSTTFNLPNLNNGSFLEGSNVVGVIKEAGLPNITGSFGVEANVGEAVKDNDITGAFTYENLAKEASSGDNITSTKFYFDASKSNAIYGASNTVQPKAITVKFCIKY